MRLRTLLYQTVHRSHTAGALADYKSLPWEVAAFQVSLFRKNQHLSDDGWSNEVRPAWRKQLGNWEACWQK